VFFVYKLRLLVSNNFFFCSSYSGWAVGPSGGVVEPDLVTRMRLGGLSDGHFSYGPSFPGVFREPFSNERHLFSDSQLHCCGPYLELEKKFFSDNAAIVRENYFDADLLLGVDPDEDLAVEEAVNYDDLVPVITAEEILWQVAAVNHISNVEIVRLAPVNSDSENEETTELVTSLVVVEAVGELADAAGGVSVDEAVKGSNYLGDTAEGRAVAPSDPGSSGGGVSMDDFLPGPRPGPVPSLTSSAAAGDEVICIFYLLISGPFCY
jgi:hypothetical protein